MACSFSFTFLMLRILITHALDVSLQTNQYSDLYFALIRKHYGSYVYYTPGICWIRLGTNSFTNINPQASNHNNQLYFTPPNSSRPLKATTVMVSLVFSFFCSHKSYTVHTTYEYTTCKLTSEHSYIHAWKRVSIQKGMHYFIACNLLA